jgi:hypothetical protein
LNAVQVNVSAPYSLAGKYRIILDNASIGKEVDGNVALWALETDRLERKALASNFCEVGEEEKSLVDAEEANLTALRALRFSDRSLASSFRCSRSSLVLAMVWKYERRGGRVRYS